MRPVVSQVPGVIITHMNASAVGKTNIEVNKAYVAGLIDGDGAIAATIEKNSENKFGFRVRVEIKITQKDNHLLLNLAKEFKAGRVSRNARRDASYTTHDWIVRDKKDCIRILEYIRPYTRLKSKQISIALKILRIEIIKQKDLIKSAKLADALSQFNVRSKNRRKNFATLIKVSVSPND